MRMEEGKRINKIDSLTKSDYNTRKLLNAKKCNKL